MLVAHVGGQSFNFIIHAAAAVLLCCLRSIHQAAMVRFESIQPPAINTINTIGPSKIGDDLAGLPEYWYKIIISEGKSLALRTRGPHS